MRARVMIAVVLSACGSSTSQNNKVLTRIDLSPTSMSIDVGQTLQYTAVGYDQSGNPLQATFTWASSDMTVASIDQTGLAMGLKAGPTQITASSGTVTSNTAGLSVNAVQTQLAITSLSPAMGDGAGGTSITITGTGFVAGSTSFMFAGRAATNVNVTSATSATASTPPEAAASPEPRGPHQLMVQVQVGANTASCSSPCWSYVVSNCTTLAPDVPTAQSAAFAANPGELQLDTDYVYWFESDDTVGGGAIKRVHKDGTGSIETVAGSLFRVDSFALDDTNVYWAEVIDLVGNGAIKSAPKDGSASPTVLATGTPTLAAGGTSPNSVFAPVILTLDGTNVLWGEAIANGMIRSVPAAGGGVTDLVPTNGFYSTVHDASYFYQVTYPSGDVLRMTRDGNTTDTLATGGGANPLYPILDGGTLFWADLEMSGAIYSASASTVGGTLNKLASARNPHGIVVDGANVYYSEDEVVRVPRAGGQLDTAVRCDQKPGSATNAFEPSALAVDATDIYVMDGNGPGVGRLLKAPKPQ
jgi:hypothetical protein